VKSSRVGSPTTGDVQVGIKIQSQQKKKKKKRKNMSALNFLGFWGILCWSAAVVAASDPLLPRVPLADFGEFFEPFEDHLSDALKLLCVPSSIPSLGPLRASLTQFPVLRRAQHQKQAMERIMIEVPIAPDPHSGLCTGMDVFLALLLLLLLLLFSLEKKLTCVV
jgi:hypothetical protein